MNDREAFDAWWSEHEHEPRFKYLNREEGRGIWQAALASERAKQAEPVAVVPAGKGDQSGCIRWLTDDPPSPGTLLYAAPSADEAVRLLRWVREKIVSGERVIDAIDAYLAKHADHR